MNRLKNFLTVLVVIGFMITALVGLSSAQPKIPMEEIHSDIPAEVRNHIELLYSSDPQEKLNSTRTLGEMGEKAIPAIPFLIEMLGDITGYYAAMYSQSVRSVKAEAAESLGNIGEPAIKSLIAELKDNKEFEARKNAIWALREIKTPLAVEPLIDIIEHDKSSTIRKKAAMALGVIKDPRAVEPMIAILKHDKDPAIREQAARVLGEIKDPRAVEPLMDAMIEEELNVRRAATGSLGMLKDPGLAELMVAALLNDIDYVVKLMAARALGDLNDPRTIEPLIIALDDDDMYVRKEAADALVNITGEGPGKSPAKWQRWWIANREELLK